MPPKRAHSWMLVSHLVTLFGKVLEILEGRDSLVETSLFIFLLAYVDSCYQLAFYFWFHAYPTTVESTICKINPPSCTHFFVVFCQNNKKGNQYIKQTIIFV